MNFLGIKSQLKDVVAKCKKRSQREGTNKDSDESILQFIMSYSFNLPWYLHYLYDHLQVFVEQSLMTPLCQLEVLHVLRGSLR